MKVSTTRPYQLVYSIYEHEYLGYLFESYVVQLDDNGRLTLQHQNISSQNAHEFSEGFDEVDLKLISLMDSLDQKAVIRFFNKRLVKPADYFKKVYEQENHKLLRAEIDRYLENRRSEILPLLHNKMLFEMGTDGEPTWKRIEILPNKASVLFHFRRNEDNTHYFPTLKYDGEKVNFQYNGAYLVCKNPAWLVSEGKLYNFEKEIDGQKLLPFLNKKFIVIPKKMEDTYYKRFIAPLIGSFDVYAKGFEISTKQYDPVPTLSFYEMASSSNQTDVFSEGRNEAEPEAKKIIFEFSFKYNNFNFKADRSDKVSVSVEKKGDSYVFHRIRRDRQREKYFGSLLKETGIELKHARAVLGKTAAFAWLSENLTNLREKGFVIDQSSKDSKRYYLGASSMKIEVKENIDWFDIYAIVNFGPYELPFSELRKIMLKKGTEITLPNGEVAVIPESWIGQFTEFFAFMEEEKSANSLKLRKHHIALVKELEQSNTNQLKIERKLENLKSFEEIEDHPVPAEFKGELRPYQKAGFNWLQFLNKYNFGGCLADDMGLGKTVQTLAMLQAEKERGAENASLLVMPTSLIYNWEMEAAKFTPGLKVFTYRGSGRIKDPAQFNGYDLVLTSYGVARLDVEELKDYYFNYLILDESQAIKNPDSNISKAVKKLKSKRRLVLTGTPLENSTLDLWSQMTFLNPGLLGNQSFFKNEFLNPIEKKQDEHKTHKLNAIIKPFILRRHKSQVATELPEKIINIQYCTMTAMQEVQYEKTKDFYRNKILEQIENHGVRRSHFLLLQGLSRLRQLANHPKMVMEDYKGDSGKLEDVTNMLANAVSEGHKLLIFSQYVKHLTIVKDYLRSANIRFSYLDGSTRDRKKEVEDFQNNDDIKVFLISLKAGGSGLNLTKADYVFLLDPWWNPATEAQAIDRAHRIGQEKKVFTYKFITRNTVEEKIITLQQRKLQLANNLISAEESFVKDLSRDDIENLFE